MVSLYFHSWLLTTYYLGWSSKVGAKGSLLPPHRGHHRHRLPLFDRLATLTVSESWAKIAERNGTSVVCHLSCWSTEMNSYTHLLWDILHGESMVFPRVAVTSIAIAFFGFRGAPRPDVKYACWIHPSLAICISAGWIKQEPGWNQHSLNHGSHSDILGLLVSLFCSH